MENIYIIIVGVLFLLAISNLVVGVSNDAVNFLVSAIGSKAGKFNVIMIMASIGIVAGAVFSNGMMEVARKGIFHPEMFYFDEVMYIFLAVMLTNIILLDFFNTFGFPTSTTVSLVFGLLGAAIGIAITKTGDGSRVTDFINTGQAMTIIGGILLSVVIAFFFGTIVQWFARLLFSFQYEKSYKYFGAAWGGLALAVITYFMFIKGFKNSSFADSPFVQWVLQHQWQVLIYSFIAWTIIFQILISLFKMNILKFVVLMGTLALAMAFAGNDLVNFIGVPLAGYSSYEFWHASGQPANSYLMTELSGAVKVNPLYLLASALIMIVTLWTSKKAKTVTETSVNLARQDAGYERFGSTQLSRSLVRWSINLSEFVGKFVPRKAKIFIESRFKIQRPKEQNEDAPAFDLIRASVNLVVASILIAIATSYKLPLSTTYVTFMVAMGTSLADRAWGKESAVFRVTGVISVITGWFFTAFVAFSLAFILALIIHYGSTFAIGLLVAVDIFLIYRSRIIHKERMEKEKEEIEKYKQEIEFTKNNIFEASTRKILLEIQKVLDFVNDVFENFAQKDRKKLKDSLKLAHQIKTDAKNLKQNIFNTVQHLSDEYLASAQYYVQVIDALREIANAVVFLGERMYEHVDNNHDIFRPSQLKELSALKDRLYNYILECKMVIENKKFQKIDDLREIKNQILLEIEKAKTKQLKMIHDKETDLINSNLYLNILAEYKNLALYFIRIVKAQKRFYISGVKAKKQKENE